VLSGHPEPAVSWHSGFRGGAHARRRTTPVHHDARRGYGVAARGEGAAAGGSPKSRLCLSRSKTVMAARMEAIMTGLRASGYAAPTQIEIVARIAEGDPDHIVPLVKEVIGKNVNVIIAAGPLVVHAARSATGTIPIIAIDLEGDPVASGMAATLARPGGNITGVFLDFPDFAAKWMEMLVESNPKLSPAAVLWDPRHRTRADGGGREGGRNAERPTRYYRGTATVRF
jgi:ABC transporter substrate binding protein